MCHKNGDLSLEGRLLPVDYAVDTYVHIMCAKWSSEVYQTIDGGLVNVTKAINRGKSIVNNIITFDLFIL